jgi:hypothetical protein
LWGQSVLAGQGITIMYSIILQSCFYTKVQRDEEVANYVNRVILRRADTCMKGTFSHRQSRRKAPEEINSLTQCYTQPRQKEFLLWSSFSCTTLQGREATGPRRHGHPELMPSFLDHALKTQDSRFPCPGGPQPASRPCTDFPGSRRPALLCIKGG